MKSLKEFIKRSKNIINDKPGITTYLTMTSARL